MSGNIVIPIYVSVALVTIGFGQLSALFTLIWRSGRYTATIEGKLNVVTTRIDALTERIKALEQK